MCKVIYSFSLKHLYTRIHLSILFYLLFCVYRRQNVEEKLRNEGVQPVKLRQKQPEMTMMWERKSLPHVTRYTPFVEMKPEYELEEPSFRYLSNIEENFLHLRQAEAKKCFCKRFLKAREIELR